MTDDLVAKTPLHDLHTTRGARMTPFAGYDMPLNYPLGVMKEHLHCRAAAGLFDVSHMGQVILRPKSGDVADAARALERLVPVSVLGLAQGRQRYGLFTNEAGGIMDDLMIANRGDHLLLVVNAACKDADLAHLHAHLDDVCDIEMLDDRALIALQGPEAGAVMQTLAPDSAGMAFMDVADLTVAGVACVASRSGYTGEDGFEISIPSDQAAGVAEKMLADDRVEAIGLGARDSLRLEAGLCLYGNDLDPKTTPVEASLIWAMQKTRRRGGEREGGFPGADVILGQLENGPSRKRVGVSPQGRAPVRAGAQIFPDETSAEPIGHVTSGGFGPSAEAPVAMGYVAVAHAQDGADLFAEVRGKRLPIKVAAMPFSPHRYKR